MGDFPTKRRPECFRKWSPRKKTRWDGMNPSPHVNQAVVKLFVEPLRKKLHYLIAKMGTWLQNITAGLLLAISEIKLCSWDQPRRSRIWWLQRKKKDHSLVLTLPTCWGCQMFGYKSINFFCPSAPQFPVEKISLASTLSPRLGLASLAMLANSLGLPAGHRWEEGFWVVFFSSQVLHTENQQKSPSKMMVGSYVQWDIR